MALKYVLFDFDGTLADSNDAVVGMLHLASEKHRGIPFSADELEEVLGKPLIEQMAFISESSKEELVEFYRAEYRKVRDTLTRPYEGVKEMLVAIKALGLGTGIVSNKGRNGINHGLELLEMSELIDISVSKDDVILSKPNPEGIFKAMKGLGGNALEGDQTIFVGDSGHDIEAGKNAGCKTILVGWTLLNIEKLVATQKPDFVAYTPTELLNFIKNQL